MLLKIYITNRSNDDRRWSGRVEQPNFQEMLLGPLQPIWPKQTCFSHCWYFRKFITKMPPLKRILYIYKKEVHRWGFSRGKKPMIDNFFLLCCRWALHFGSFSGADCSRRELSEVRFLLRRVFSTSELVKGAHSSRPPGFRNFDWSPRLLKIGHATNPCPMDMVVYQIHHLFHGLR